MKPNPTALAPLRTDAELDGPLTLARRARLVAPFLPWPRTHLVDYGCGTGAQTRLFAEKFDRVTGVDTAVDQLDAFTAAAADQGWQGRFTALHTDGHGLSLPDAGADCIMSFKVLEHIADEAALLAEMWRVLRPGGRLFLSVSNRWWPTGGADRREPPRQYRKREIRQLLNAAGFTIDSTFNMTAPLENGSGGPLNSLARATLFRADRTSLPLLATEIMVAATR